MTAADDADFADGGEGYCEGDPSPDDIDWEAVERLAGMQELVKELPPDEQQMANLGILHEMYGQSLEIL